MSFFPERTYYNKIKETWKSIGDKVSDWWNSAFGRRLSASPYTRINYLPIVNGEDIVADGKDSGIEIILGSS